MKKIAIAIPSYGNRYGNKPNHLLPNLNNFDKEFDVYVFCSESDKHLSEYYNYDWDSNVHIVVTPCNTIFEKRKYMLEYLHDNGYNGYFQYDDDVTFSARKITAESKRATSNAYKPIKCDMNEMLHRILRVADEYDAGYVTVIRPGFVAFQRPGKVVLNGTCNVAQFGYFNIDKLYENNIQYDASGWINEDTDLMIKIAQHGINYCNVCDYMFETSNNTLKNVDQSSIYVGLSQHQILIMHQFVKYHVPLVLDKNGFLKARINLKKYWCIQDLPDISSEYDQKLMEICKTDKIEDVINYIKENNK